MVMASCGDVATQEALAATAILRDRLPDLKVRFVNVVDLFRMQRASEHPHGSTDRDFDSLFTRDRPVIFNFHGYPWLIHKLAYKFHNHDNIHVRGYKERGNINTPLELAILNQTDRFTLVIDVIDRVAGARRPRRASEGGDAGGNHRQPHLCAHARYRPRRDHELGLALLRRGRRRRWRYDGSRNWSEAAAVNETQRLAGNVEATRTGLQAQTLRQAVLDNLVCLQGKYPDIASPRDWYMALAYTVRDRMLERWVSTVRTYAAQDVKVVCYLSAEFLIGPQLGNNLVNLGIEANAREAMEELGQDLDVLRRDRGGAGARERRPRPACRLLPRLACDARGAGDRLRPPLRVRHLRPGDPRRRPGRGHRQVAAEGQCLGDPAPGRLLLRQLRRPYRKLHRRGGALPGALDPGAAGQGHGLRHPGARLPRQHLQHPPAVAERGGRVVRLPGLQPRRLLRRGPGEGGLRDDLEGALSERRARGRAAPAAWRSSISSSPARCRTCCACST